MDTLTYVKVKVKALGNDDNNTAKVFTVSREDRVNRYYYNYNIDVHWTSHIICTWFASAWVGKYSWKIGCNISKSWVEVKLKLNLTDRQYDVDVDVDVPVWVLVSPILIVSVLFPSPFLFSHSGFPPHHLSI